jgi:hypothetical protein
MILGVSLGYHSKKLYPLINDQYRKTNMNMNPLQTTGGEDEHEHEPPTKQMRVVMNRTSLTRKW